MCHWCCFLLRNLEPRQAVQCQYWPCYKGAAILGLAYIVCICKKIFYFKINNSNIFAQYIDNI